MKQCKVLGFGSPILDLLVRVDDSFLREHVSGEKGGMGMLSAQEQKELIGHFPEGSLRKAIGGSSFNTISALASLKVPTSFLGTLGGDADGDYYRESFAAKGGDVSRFRVTEKAPTATCISMVTPDSERTMRTHLGAALLFDGQDLSGKDFESITHLHVEGYTLFLENEMTERVMSLAKEHGCTVSFDLASFEVVQIFRSRIRDLLEKYVDLVFANEDEARQFCSPDRELNVEDALRSLRELCPAAVVKVGKKGSCISCGAEKSVFVEPALVRAVDTTGAGDLYQAGFLYGYLLGYTPEQAGKMGSVLGAEIVQVMGAQIPEERWSVIQEKFNQIKGA